MIRCKTCKNAFEEYALERVIWSADSIPVCPYCRTSAYEGDFEQADPERDETVAAKGLNAVLYHGEQNVYYYIKAQKEKNRYICFPEGDRKDTPRQREIRAIFHKAGSFVSNSYEDAELIIDNLNDDLQNSPAGLQIAMPMTEGDEDFIIQLDNGIELVINTFNEYFGRGGSSSGVTLRGIMVDEDLSDDEIQKAVTWLNDRMP